MYGAAGWAHTAGQPKLPPAPKQYFKGAKPRPREIKEAGTKPKFDKANEAGMRRTSVMFRKGAK